MRTYTLLQIVWCLAVLPGCVNTDPIDWDRTTRLNTLEAYKAYVVAHPRGVHVAEATERIAERREERAWSLTVSQDNKDSYETYIDEFPAGPHARVALARLSELREEDELWQVARAGADLASLEAYISAYPDGRYVTEAGQLQVELAEQRDKDAWDEARSRRNVAAIDSFLKTHPESRFATQARQLRIEFLRAEDDRAFEKATERGNVEAYQEYLAAYPEGRHVDQATKEVATAALLEKIREDRPALEGFLENQSLGRWYWAGREAIEDLIITEILENGVGERFLIADLLPEHEGSTGSITVEEVANSSSIRLKTLYPRDKLDFRLSQFGAEPVRPLGDRSIWRFKGKVEFMGYTFSGSEREPLSFMFLDSTGFVYLAGQGSVELKDRTVQLPLPPRESQEENDKDDFQRLTQQLEDTDAAVRDNALAALQEIYNESPSRIDKQVLVPKLCHILKEDDNGKIKARALPFLLDIEPDKSKLGNALAPMLSDERWQNRANACKVIASLDVADERFLEGLIGLLKDEFAQVRYDAARALEGFGLDAQSAIPLLQKIVAEDEVPQLRVEAGWPLMSILGKVQAMKIPTVDKEDIHSVGLPIGPKGQWPRNLFLQVFGRRVGLSGDNANRVLALTDKRTPPETDTFAVASYGDENRAIWFRKRAVVHQYFITDRDYTVFPEGTLSVPPEGPFATIEVHVKGEDDAARTGAEVKIVRQSDTITRITEADGIAAVQLRGVKTDNVEIHVAPAKGKPAAWKGSLITYMRAAQPDTVIYPVEVVLKDS